MKKLVYIMFVALFAAACNKGSDYYQDSGVHDEHFNGTIMDYLDANAQRPIDLFDTLVQVIRHAEMEDVLRNEQVTFFAVPDPSINRSIEALNNFLYQSGQQTITSFREVKPEVWRYFLSQYIIRGDLGLIDFRQVDTLRLDAFPGQLYQTYNTEEALNVGAIYHPLVNDGVQIPFSGPRQVLISHIPDFSQPLKDWVNVVISTSNIRPINGRIHVVNYNRHTFGFTSSKFILMARERGIDYE